MTEKKGFKAKVKDAAKGIASKLAAGFGYDLTAKFDVGSGSIELPIDMEGDTVWATQQQIAELFGVGVPAISKQIARIYSDDELTKEATLSKMERVQLEGKREVSRTLDHYNLDMILAVGYQLSGKKATAFRKWANSVLKGYIQDGYALNGTRLDADPAALLSLSQEVRAIRTSEKNMWSQVTEVFAFASIDYDSSSDIARKFFSEAQDTMHYAATEKTASEILVSKCDASKPNMGLVALGNQRPTKTAAKIAKNYCTPEELRRMELIGEAFLLYVEGLAEREKQVSMSRLLEKFKAMVEFYDYPVFPGYVYKRPTGAQAKDYAGKQFDLFQQSQRSIT